MAKLILTEKEKKMPLFKDFTDADLGKAVKSLMGTILTTSDERNQMFLLSAAIVLCDTAHRTNADTMKVSVDGLHNKSNDFGNWEVTIKKV